MAIIFGPLGLAWSSLDAAVNRVEAAQLHEMPEALVELRLARDRLHSALLSSVGRDGSIPATADDPCGSPCRLVDMTRRHNI